MIKTILALVLTTSVYKAQCYQTIVNDNKKKIHGAILCDYSLEIKGDTLMVIHLLLDEIARLREDAYDVAFKYENVIESGINFTNGLPYKLKTEENKAFSIYLKALKGFGYNLHFNNLEHNKAK